MTDKDGHWEAASFKEVFSTPIPVLTLLCGCLFWGSLLLKLFKILTVTWMVFFSCWVAMIAVFVVLVLIISRQDRSPKKLL